MHKQPRSLFTFLLLFIFSISAINFALAQSNGGGAPLKPPMAEKKTKTTNIHGETLVDEYFWLREKTNPDVMAHLKAEDNYAESVMKPTKALQEKLYNEMVNHIKETDEQVPYRRGDYFYYTRTEKGKQYSIYCRKKGSTTAAEEIVLDVNELAKGQKYMGIGAFVPSDDGNLLAYSTDNTGYRQYVLQIKDLRTGKVLPERVERVNNVAWSTDNKTIFYVTEDAVTKRSDKFFRHVLGADKYDLVYDEKDELFDIATGRTRDKAIVFLQITSKTSTEVRYIPADKPDAPLKVVLARQPDHEYDLDHRGDLFYIRTKLSRRDGARQRSVGSKLERVCGPSPGGEGGRRQPFCRSRCAQ
jgi:oligopeptidase B